MLFDHHTSLEVYARTYESKLELNVGLGSGMDPDGEEEG